MEMLRDRINGLRTALAEKRRQEAVFIKAETLAEQVETARTKADKLDADVEQIKARKVELKEQRAAILREALRPISEEITHLLPHGRGVVSLEENLFVGWEKKEGEQAMRSVPHLSLSGGERVCFDAALSRALLRGKGPKILVLEAAELDDKNFAMTLSMITKTHPDAQVIINTWWNPIDVPPDWTVVKLGESRE